MGSVLSLTKDSLPTHPFHPEARIASSTEKRDPFIRETKSMPLLRKCDAEHSNVLRGLPRRIWRSLPCGKTERHHGPALLVRSNVSKHGEASGCLHKSGK